MNRIIDNKWLLVSCLQKSIRRGFEEEAVLLWNHLKNIDRFYTIYRLSIMAIEDVGLGNLDIIYDFLSTGLKKVNLEQKGGNEYIEYVVRELAKSVKDRSACDITWLASYQNWEKEVNQDFLKNEYENENNSLQERILAGWILVGMKKIKHNKIHEFDEKNNWIDFIEIQKRRKLDEKIIKIIEESYLYQKEPHLFALPLLFEKMQEEKDMQIGKSNYKTGDYKEIKIEKNVIEVQGLPILLEGIDGHTSEGKKVIQKLLNEKDIQQYIKVLPIEQQEYLLKHIIFKLEGQVVNKRLIYPTGIQIYQNAQNFYKNSSVDFGTLVKKVEEKIPHMNVLRKELLKYSMKKTYS